MGYSNLDSPESMMMLFDSPHPTPDTPPSLVTVLSRTDVNLTSVLVKLSHLNPDSERCSGRLEIRERVEKTGVNFLASELRTSFPYNPGDKNCPPYKFLPGVNVF